MNKKCVFILPYFGEFNNYFPLFLKTCRTNKLYHWIVLTDNNKEYDYPENVYVINTTLEKIKEKAEKKLGFSISLSSPYKLCDYKPAYGFLFEEYLTEFEYWGHCDCDLIFGNLDKILTPLLDKGYDKLFAVGHLTIYKNTYNNNRRFMNFYKGKKIYKEAFTTDKIYVFDEDYDSDYSDNNVHSIFMEDGAAIYANDLSMNTSTKSGRFINDSYNKEARKFQKKKYVPTRYYWSEGNIISLSIDKETKQLIRNEYLYMHFQLRKMRMSKNIINKNLIQILPDRFMKEKRLPINLKEMNIFSINFSYLYWFDVYIKKFKKKLIDIIK